MTFRIGKNSLLSIAFFILTLAGCKYFYEIGLNLAIETLGCLILIIHLIINRKKIKKQDPDCRIKLIDIIVLLCFVVGILLQHVTVKRRFILLFTMMVIWMCIFYSQGDVVSPKIIRKMSYSILWGVIVTCLITCIVRRDYLFDSGSVLGANFAFSAGVIYKNYFGANMVAVYTGLFVYGRNEKKKNVDLIVRAISFIMVIISGSKGACIMLLIFLFSVNIDKIKRINKSSRRVVFSSLFVIGLCLGFVFFKEFALSSSTYQFRFNGLTNYILYYKNDFFHLFFGNAENVYDQKTSYVLTVRSITGWNGSLEFSWLDILIKNGALGIIGFILVFMYYFWLARKEKDWSQNSIIYSYLFTLIISSLVETYIQSIHSAFGLNAYLILSGYLLGESKISRKLRSYLK